MCFFYFTLVTGFVPCLSSRRHSGVYSWGLPEPTEHAASRQGVKTAGKREGQREIQGIRPPGEIFVWTLFLWILTLNSLFFFFFFINKPLFFRTVNRWCPLLSSSNPTLARSLMTSSHSPCRRGRRKTKTRTRRAKQLRSLGGQRIFTQYPLTCYTQVVAGERGELVALSNMLGFFHMDLCPCVDFIGWEEKHKNYFHFSVCFRVQKEFVW